MPIVTEVEEGRRAEPRCHQRHTPGRPVHDDRGGMSGIPQRRSGADPLAVATDASRTEFGRPGLRCQRGVGDGQRQVGVRLRVEHHQPVVRERRRFGDGGQMPPR